MSDRVKISLSTRTTRALDTLRRCAAVQRVRVATFDTLVVRSSATGEEVEITGPCEVLMVDDRMVAQGW